MLRLEYSSLRRYCQYPKIERTPVRAECSYDSGEGGGVGKEARLGSNPQPVCVE